MNKPVENIDLGYLALCKIIEEIPNYKDTIFTEEDTRLKIIDRILVDVLGWPYAAILTEALSGKGFIDYKLNINKCAYLVVEAKRDGINLGCMHRSSGQPFKLNGPVFKNTAADEGIEQAIQYCGRSNAELACVSNGKEWIIFRGSRIGDGIDTKLGMAFIFSNLDEVKNNFSLFFDLLAHENVAGRKFRSYFQEAEGQPIRKHVFCKSLRAPESRRIIEPDEIAADITKVMDSFFRRLKGEEDPDMIRDCFIVTKESELADQRLLRISEDLINRVKSLETDKAARLIELIKRAKEENRNEFIMLIGHKGAGKSTFIDRFFSTVLPAKLRNECIVVSVDLKKNKGDEATIANWLDQNLLCLLEKEIFKGEAPNYDELQGMFFDVYQRWSGGSFKHMYETNKSAFKDKFGEYIENARLQDPHDYICRLIRNIVRSREKVPCVVFDNADHFSITFQERVFQYARSIYESENCLIITPLTDKTSWQLSSQGVFESFESEVLYLPVPSPKRILEMRIKYIEKKLTEKKEDKEIGRYFLTKGIRLTIEDLHKFVRCLQSVFIQTGYAATWLGNLSNYDNRHSLEIARNVMTSPYLKIYDLFAAYVVGNSMIVKDANIKKAIIKDKYDIYPSELNKYVHNIFALNTEIDTTPLLGIRILQMLRDVPHIDSQGEENFIDIQQVFNYFSALSIDPQIISLWLKAMLKTNLCLSYDPTIDEIKNVTKIEISSSGKQHYFWGLYDEIYLTTMIDVTNILERNTFDNLESLHRQGYGIHILKSKQKIFLEYIQSEDMKYCKLQDHKSFEGQRIINKKISLHIQKLAQDIDELKSEEVYK